MDNSIQIVLVLYKTTLEESLTYKSLRSFLKDNFFNYELLVYNNSPELTIKSAENILVVNSKSNDMLVGAYNYALKRAIETNKRWLMLLDQDTQLTKDYFSETKLFLENQINVNFVAAIPVLQKCNLHLSPQKYNPILGPYWFTKPLTQIASEKSECVTAFNSATILDVIFIQSIGGFSERYPLDYLDHWYFYQIYKAKRKIYLLNAVIEQNLSLLDYAKGMTFERYKIFTESEKRFATDLGFLTVLSIKLRLLFRFLKQICSKDKSKYSLITLYSFLGVKKRTLK